MEKILSLYTYIDGVNDEPFPNEEQQVVTSDFRCDYKRMGAVPTISCTVMHPLCLDKLWTDNVYATFNGEKFFIKQVATSSYDNTDSRYKHEVELVSERIILDNVYVYDVVTSDITYDKPVSNGSNFVFFGDIHEFAERLNYSLEYTKVGYTIVVDDGISSEAKMVSFQDQFFSNAIQESYNTYEIPYYYVGKVIHIGFTNNAIAHTFKYGKDESLLSIQKQNANYKIVNRVTGVGSADNIPYYYPNDYESKEEVEAHGGTWINPQTNLMPSIYRESLGEERFYEALNNTYVSPQTDEYYEFENPFVEGKPKEHIVNFDDIKPTIKGMTNASNQRIDMFSEFAYDLNDNDETDEEGNYLHPYFFGKLRRFDGEYGFNLFDHSIEEDEMVISMTSGSCGACEFVIGVDEDTQKNPVQVNEWGNLLRDENGDVIRSGSFQDRQNDTQNYEVWIALRKDINTFGVIMPNATNNYKPSTDDTFVILHIDLPKSYILAAEDRLKEELIKYMAMNNSEKFNFSISFSRIFFAENPDILSQLDENARIQIEYDDTRYELYVSSYSYSMSSNKPLPEIKVELSDTLTVSQNALQTAINDVKHDIMNSVGSIDWLKQGLKYFLRKDTNDRTRGKLSTDVAFEVGNYVSGASGAIIYKDMETGQTVGELDKLYVRMKAYFETLTIIEAETISGKQIVSPAGSVRCTNVEEYDDYYRCYFLNEQDGEKIENKFIVGDQAYSQMFNAKTGTSNNISNRYYWRLVTGVGENYIDLSKTDSDADSDVPMVGDILNHRGHRYPENSERMNFIETSTVDGFSPSITLFHGVNSFSLADKAYVQFGVDKTTNKAFMNVYGDMYVGDRNQTTYMRYTQEDGLEICGKLAVGTKLGDEDLQELINSATPEGYQEFVDKVTQDLEGLQAQIDGVIDSYFFQYEPSLDNYPASDWDTESEKKSHLNDTFTNLVDGRSWRWSLDGTYKWVEITDTATTKALALAGQAKNTADGKRRVFVDTPYPPYDNGDLWSRGSDYPLMICVVPKESGSYSASDWDYADNTEKIREELESLVQETTDELNNNIGKATEAANTYTDNAKSSLQDSIDEMNAAKANINDVYTKAQADGKISEAEQDAIDAARQQADAAIALSEEIIKAYADGIVDEEEAARINQAEENLAAAKAYAEEQAQAAKDEIENSYLFQALQEAQSTEISNGLVLTSLIQLRDASSNIMSGINGLINANNGDKSIATWWGGGMYDLLDYYTWDGNQWVVKSGLTPPSNIPSGLIRMDGTGYLANGKFWWDEDGKIYADPTALFLSFDVNAESATLSATILDILDKQTEFTSMWSLETDSMGTKYLYTKYPLVSQGGVTMYAGISGLDLPSIYDALPIDGTTIYWENGVLKAQGTSGGGVADSVAWDDVTGKPTFATVATSGSYNDLLNKPTIPTTLPNPATLSWSGYSSGSYDGSSAKSITIPNNTNQLTNGAGFITGITGSMVTTALGYTPYSSSNPNGYITSSSIPTSLKNPYSLSWSGYSSGSYDGSSAKSITIPSNTNQLTNGAGFITASALSPYATTSAVNNALSGYLPLTGGTISGQLNVTNINNVLTFNSLGHVGLGTNNPERNFVISASNGDGIEFTPTSTYGNILTYNRSTSKYLPLVLSASMVQVGLTNVPCSLLVTGGLSVSSTFSESGTAGVPGVFLRNGGGIEISHNTTPYIDFHLNNDTADYTNRLYCDTNGYLRVMKNFSVAGTFNATYIYQNGVSLATILSGYLPSSSYTAADVLAKLKTVDGAGSGLDADLLDGKHYSDIVTGNVASATKLQTARTIWGQSFDGTGDVSGALSGVTNINSAIHINSSGNVLIGTTRNVGIKAVIGRENVAGSMSASTLNESAMMVGVSNPTHSYGIHLWTEGSGSGFIQQGRSDTIIEMYSLCLNPFGGNVGIGTTTPSYKLHVVGNILTTGGVTMYSDIRKKHKLQDVELTLKQVADAPLIEHYYLSDEQKTTHVGSIAQYWAGLNDWFCKEDNEGYYTMEIQNAALASAISVARELTRYENKTDKTIRMLKKRISELEDEIEKLKTA